MAYIIKSSCDSSYDLLAGEGTQTSGFQGIQTSEYLQEVKPGGLSDYNKKVQGGPNQQTTQSACPCCGYCPHCGRGGYTPPYNPYPAYPQPIWVNPTYPQYTPYAPIVTCGTEQTGYAH